MAEALDAVEITARVAALSNAAQVAIQDAFGSAVAYGLEVTEESGEPWASIASGRCTCPVSAPATSPDPSVPIGMDGHAVAGSLAEGSRLSLERYRGRTVTVGLVAYPGADGLVIPQVIEGGSRAIAACVPLALCQLGGQQVELVRDMRQPYSRAVIIEARGLSPNNGGQAFTGPYDDLDDSELDVFATAPGQVFEVQVFAQIDSADWAERGVEVALRIDGATAAENVYAKRGRDLTGEVYVSDPGLYAVPASPPYEVVVEMEPGWNFVRATNAKVRQAGDWKGRDRTDNESPNSHQWYSNGPTYVFHSSDAGKEVQLHFIRTLDLTEAVGSVGSQFANRDGQLMFWEYIAFDDVGRHTIQLATRGSGSISTARMLVRPLPVWP